MTISIRIICDLIHYTVRFHILATNNTTNTIIGHYICSFLTHEYLFIYNSNKTIKSTHIIIDIHYCYRYY